LSELAMAVLRQMAQLGNEGFVFPGVRQAATLSDVTLARALDVSGGNGATVHGMRSAFRDWAAELTKFPREIVELSLAHQTFIDDLGQTVGSSTELAYKRGDQLERRRPLMQAWAKFCSRPMIAAEVISLRAAAAE
jgi:integrase